jgi:plasmid segregation protein ParM
VTTIVRAVDVGFANTKFVTRVTNAGIECDHFPSLAYPSVREASADALGGRRRTIAIPIEGLFYEVGPEIHLAADAFRPNHFHDQFTESPTYLALLRAALYYMKVETIDLLVVGLPVAVFLARKAALERLACGDHSLGGERKVVVRKPLAVAQPQGALVYYAASTERLRELQDEQSLVIDVGARTFDWLATRGLRPVSKRCHSVNRGVFDVLQALAQQISLDIGADYRDLDAIDAAIRKRKPLSICQHPYPLDKLERISTGIAEQAVLAMQQSVGDLTGFHHIVLAGGGAFLFRRVLCKALAKYRIHELTEPMYANVRGFQLAGQDRMAAMHGKAAGEIEPQSGS